MTSPMEASICSSDLSLSGMLPLHQSDYVERSAIFNDLSGIPLPMSLLVFEEPLAGEAKVETWNSPPWKSPAAQAISAPLLNNMKKLWEKICSIAAKESDNSTAELEKQKAALEFKTNLQAIDDAHGLDRFCFDAQIPRKTFCHQDFLSLDEALDDAMAASLIVEGGDEEKGSQDDIVKVTLIVRKKSDGTEVRCILQEDVDLEINPDYL